MAKCCLHLLRLRYNRLKTYLLQNFEFSIWKISPKKWIPEWLYMLWPKEWSLVVANPVNCLKLYLYDYWTTKFKKKKKEENIAIKLALVNVHTPLFGICSFRQENKIEARSYTKQLLLPKKSLFCSKSFFNTRRHLFLRSTIK